MKILSIISIIFLSCLMTFSALAGTKVLMKTNKGDITLELADDKAPITIQNFLNYVNSGFYDGLIFHRVIPNFMIQGGGFDSAMNQKETQQPIKNEADNGLKNKRGTIAMARTTNVNSATSQFFINSVDNDFLNYTSSTQQGMGYAVFGEVIDGMDVVDAISAVQTTNRNGFADVPSDSVIIEKVSIIK